MAQPTSRVIRQQLGRVILRDLTIVAGSAQADAHGKDGREADGHGGDERRAIFVVQSPDPLYVSVVTNRLG